jgi:hypothetical protein
VGADALRCGRALPIFDGCKGVAGGAFSRPGFPFVGNFEIHVRACERAHNAQFGNLFYIRIMWSSVWHAIQGKRRNSLRLLAQFSEPKIQLFELTEYSD